jgi:chromosome partitioning protein
MNILTFAALKGGVGKTMTAFNISSFLAESGKKVLVVDVDPQGNITNNLGIDKTTTENSINDIFESHNSTIDDIIIKSPVKELKTLDIIPSSIFLFQTELKLISLAGRELILKNYFEDYEEHLNKYDYVIFDTNPSMSIINQNAFCISDKIILISDVSFNSLEGIELFSALWKDISNRLRKKANISAMIINNLDKRLKISNDFIDYCKSHEIFRDLALDTYIVKNVKLKESELEARPINLYDKTSSGYKSFKKLIKEMRERKII